MLTKMPYSASRMLIDKGAVEPERSDHDKRGEIPFVVQVCGEDEIRARRSLSVQRLNHHWLERVWKHPNNHVSCAGRCNEQQSVTKSTLMAAWSRGKHLS